MVNDTTAAESRALAAGKTALKALLAAAAFVLIARKVDLRDLATRLERLTVFDVTLLLGLYGLQTAMGVVRWWRLLARVGERVPFVALAGDVLVGVTFNMFLPTSVGGDVVRALRARRRTRVPHHAWSTSIFERIAGLVALGAIGGIAATAGLGRADAVPFALRITAGAVTVAVVLAFFVAAKPFRLLVHLLEARLPAAAVTDMRGIIDDLEGPLATNPARLEAIGLSLVSQVVALLFVIVGADALGAPGHTLAIVIGIPLIFVLSMVPLTLGGHGLREGLYVVVLGALGVPSGVALGLAATFLAGSIVYAAIGAVVLLVSKVTPTS